MGTRGIMTTCVRTGLLLFLLTTSPAFLRAKADDDSNKPAASRENLVTLETLSDNKNLKNGLEAHSGKALLSIVALRDDVLRIRISQDGTLPEDASWAVLPEARTSNVDVIAEDTAQSIGFHTKAL